jgi:hypothetical protein
MIIQKEEVYGNKKDDITISNYIEYCLRDYDSTDILGELEKLNKKINKTIKSIGDVVDLLHSKNIISDDEIRRLFVPEDRDKQEIWINNKRLKSY